MVVALIFFAVITATFLPFHPSLRDGLEIFLFLMALLGVMATVAWKKSSRDSRALAGVARSPSSAYARARTVPKPDAKTLAELDRVRLQACPRRVQLNQMSRAARFVVMIFPIGMWLFGIHDLLLPNRPIGLAAHGLVEARIWGAGILVCGTVLWFLLRHGFQNKRHLKLLQNGQVALARVTGPFSGAAALPGITYEFTDRNGHTVQGKNAVIQTTLNEDDYLLVFYDPQKSQECIAQCATNYELGKG
jgi:hypothetical protein